MRFFRLVSCICLLSLCFVCFSFADTVSGSAIEDPSVTTSDIFEVDNVPSGLTVVVNNPDNSSLIEALDRIGSSSSSETDFPSASFEGMQLMSVNISNERISASDANGFKAVVLDLIGDYETIITDYTYQNQVGNVQHSIDVTPDWSWISSIALFAIVVYCAFRIVGGILCNR